MSAWFQIIVHFVPVMLTFRAAHYFKSGFLTSPSHMRHISGVSSLANCGYSSLPLCVCGKAKGNTNFLTLWLLLKEQLQGHNGRAHAGHGLWVTGNCVNIHKKMQQDELRDKMYPKGEDSFKYIYGS